MFEGLELRHLRYFVAVAEELSFRRAAERLHISQPPLSRQIGQLEALLGVSLFRRSKTGVSLTGAGQALLPEARNTLDQANRAFGAARGAARPGSRPLAIGYTTVFDRSAFPDVLTGFQRLFPDCPITVKGDHSIRLIREIRKGSLDAALVALHTDAAGLTVQPVQVEPVVVALPSGHPLARKRRLALRDLAGQPLFWFERRLNPGYYDYCQAVFAAHGFTPQVVPEPADHHVLLGLIAEGQGIALLSTSLSRIRRDGVAFRALRPEIELTMGVALVYEESRRHPSLPRFIAALPEQARQPRRTA